MRLFLYLPTGKRPPLYMFSFWSGAILSISTSLSTPMPLHRGQAPCGELNEKVCGAGSLYEIPLVGHISFRLKYVGVSSPCGTIISTPLPCCMAKFIDC